MLIVGHIEQVSICSSYYFTELQKEQIGLGTVSGGRGWTTFLCSHLSATLLFAIHVEGLGDLLDPVHDVPVLASLDPGSQLLKELVRVPPSHLARNEEN